MFTVLEMLAMVVSESSLGAYVCQEACGAPLLSATLAVPKTSRAQALGRIGSAED